MKIVFGILIIVVGSSIMLISMIMGIYVFAGSLYEDLYEFPIGISNVHAQLETNSFPLEADKTISVWLKLPDRRIDNKNYMIEVKLLDGSGDTVKTSWEDFRFGYYRNSAGHGQYYRILTYKTNKELEARLFCSSEGTWKPPYDGSIVVRESKPLSLPLKELGLILVGAFIATLGIIVLARKSS